MACRNSHRFAAFSLLELIIVLMVMIGLLAIAWPNLQKPLRRNSLNEAAQTLREAIDDSRYLAITTGTPVFIRFRSGDSRLHAGTFDSFASDEDELGLNAASVGGSTNGLQNTNSVGALGPENTLPKLRTWTLPDAVVIDSVRWTLAAPLDPLDDIGAESAENMLSSSGTARNTSVKNSASRTDAMQSTESGMDASRDRGLEQTQSDSWLAIVATGQGRDAAIVLFDPTINEELTVTFASATGALEIVR